MNSSTDSDYCRVCLTLEKSDLRSLETVADTKSLKIFYEACTSINIEEDEFSRFICGSCETDLIAAFGFRIKAIEALDKLKNSLVEVHEFDLKGNYVPLGYDEHSLSDQYKDEPPDVNLEAERKPRRRKKRPRSENRICSGCHLQFDSLHELVKHMEANRSK